MWDTITGLCACDLTGLACVGTAAAGTAVPLKSVSGVSGGYLGTGMRDCGTGMVSLTYMYMYICTYGTRRYSVYISIHVVLYMYMYIHVHVGVFMYRYLYK